ncbi:MAG: hypothetical protein Q8P66_01455 [Candidatus Colwellbacteria bacterium]|nr:hypothetical protein [Candidatus Colwellbacteria bacterium]
MGIIQKVKELNLPNGSYVVVGSGTLAALGIREAQDVDLVISSEVYKKLRQEDWKEKSHDDGSSSLVKNTYEAFLTWDSKDTKSNLLEDLLGDAHVIDGVPFVNIKRLLEWKKRKGRDKDLTDVELIKDYLKGKP